MIDFMFLFHLFQRKVTIWHLRQQMMQVCHCPSTGNSCIPI